MFDELLRSIELSDLVPGRKGVGESIVQESIKADMRPNEADEPTLAPLLQLFEAADVMCLDNTANKEIIRQVCWTIDFLVGLCVIVTVGGDIQNQLVKFARSFSSCAHVVAPAIEAINTFHRVAEDDLMRVAYIQKLISVENKEVYKRVSIRCLCTLLEAVPHFNFWETLVAAVVRNLSSLDDVVRSEEKTDYAYGKHPLLAPCLNGIWKLSHLIDLDFMPDLMNHLKKLAESGHSSDGSSANRFQPLTACERLQCCIVAFKVMKSNLDALNVDLQEFYVQLYHLILEYRPGRDKESMAALATLNHLLLKNTKLRNLLENDEGVGSDTGGISKYQPYATDPNLSGALASVLWELNLLYKHYHPDISKLAAGISTMNTANNEVFHSNLSPQQAFKKLSLEHESFTVPTVIKGASTKRKKGSTKLVSGTSQEVELMFDSDKIASKLSYHFLVGNSRFSSGVREEGILYSHQGSGAYTKHCMPSSEERKNLQLLTVGRMTDLQHSKTSVLPNLSKQVVQTNPSATVIWLLFEWIGYHLLTFVCHALILMLALLFMWSNLSFFLNKAPLEFPNIVFPEGLCTSIALCIRDECNLAIGIFYDVASGKDLKRFLYAILTLWIVSVVGSWFDFLTLLYMTFVMLFTLPLLYEKHEDQVDTYAKKATVQLKRQYGVLDEKVLQN